MTDHSNIFYKKINRLNKAELELRKELEREATIAEKNVLNTLKNTVILTLGIGIIYFVYKLFSRTSTKKKKKVQKTFPLPKWVRFKSQMQLFIKQLIFKKLFF